MSNPICQVQVRLGSTRLPGKVLYPLESRRVIGWVIDRCTAAETVTDAVVAVGNEPENEAITEWCERNGVRHATGPEGNLLERHLAVAEAYSSDPVVRVTGDCPFVPPAEIDRMVGEHESNDARYTTNVTDDMPIGTAVDVIDREVLEELRELGDSHPVRRLRENPDRWDVAFSPNERWVAVSEAHIAVDTPSDYWRVTDALEAVGDNPLDIAEWMAQRQGI
ncbi:cytidylyltransferase domain-containing protein [Halopiger xanaduensis]|uniref:Acylneuraminate cytidylyltransferase n=1 Tax=Halopiger xanaduensis (strain DSM 18323 / JCM 14033 / SH-6) TaxID=797210 RepID=F8DAP2_HALXS|nr:NTP transferase domain-containing protein [Halopiger xanaduensis]AEH36984.1 acylneuraminate cytidylyltransferase [Halopiger xanaduensis SH-6]